MHRPRILGSLTRLVACSVALPAVAAAQRPSAPPAASAPAASAPTVRQGDWLVSVNPLGLLAGGLTAEAERRLGTGRTGAVAVNYWGAWGASYLSVDAKLRFYRRAAGGKVLITDTAPADFEGLSYGPMVGFQRIAYDACAAISSVCSASGITAGGTVDYGWRLGKEKAFAILAGAGLKTGFGFDAVDDGVGTAHVTYPFARLSVGYVLAKGK